MAEHPTEATTDRRAGSTVGLVLFLLLVGGLGALSYWGTPMFAPTQGDVAPVAAVAPAAPAAPTGKDVAADATAQRPADASQAAAAAPERVAITETPGDTDEGTAAPRTAQAPDDDPAEAAGPEPRLPDDTADGVATLPDADGDVPVPDGTTERTTDLAAVSEEAETTGIAPAGAETGQVTLPPPPSASADLPRFDIVRIDPEGFGVVAGRAAPGSTVRVQSGENVIATAEADATGQFVAFIETPQEGEGRSLTLSALSGQQEIESAERILVLPTEGEDDVPTIVSATEEEVRIIQPSSLGKVDGVTIDSISYDEAGAVKLTGRAPKAQPIRVYVNGRSVGASEASAGGTWSTVLAGVDEGVYTLRVDALRPDGSVETRSETPFQRVYPTAEQSRNPTQITVQPGNSLWVMAQERYGSGFLYTQIFAANRDAIRDPDLIYPGQIFALPSEADLAR